VKRSNPAFLGYASNPVEPEPSKKQLREEYISVRFEEVWNDSNLLVDALMDHGLVGWDEICAAVLAAATRDVDNRRS
jgi:hypothetical protein